MWIKLDQGFFHNPTWLQHPPDARQVFLYLLCEISLYGGKVHRVSDAHWNSIAISHILRIGTPETVAESMRSLEESGKVIRDSFGVGVAGFEEYQRDPSARARKERWKEKSHDGTFQCVPERSGTRGDVLERAERVDQNRAEQSRTEEIRSEPPIPPKGGSRPRAKKSTVCIDDPEFDTFWRSYPRREGKGKAREAFARARQSAGLQTILAAIDAKRGCAQWQRNGGQFIPLPATWLNQQRWEDDGGDPVPYRSEREIENDAYLGRLAALAGGHNGHDRGLREAGCSPVSKLLSLPFGGTIDGDPGERAESPEILDGCDVDGRDETDRDED